MSNPSIDFAFSFNMSCHFIFQCSFYPPCKSSPTKIKEAVDVYENHYGVIGLPFNCWFSRNHTGHAIRTKRFQVYHIVNGFLWSIIILLMATATLMYTIHKRGCNLMWLIKLKYNYYCISHETLWNFGLYNGIYQYKKTARWIIASIN
jgi:hypothetical protein